MRKVNEAPKTRRQFETACLHDVMLIYASAMFLHYGQFFSYKVTKERGNFLKG